jgi:hypothetical protein
LTGADYAVKARELVPKVLTACAGNRVRLAPVFDSHRTNPAAFLKARNGTVQRPRAKACSGKALDILHHGVSVFVAPGETREDEKRRVSHRYYASRSISYGVISLPVKQGSVLGYGSLNVAPPSWRLRCGLEAERSLVPVNVFVEPLGSLAVGGVAGVKLRRLLAFGQRAGEVALPFEHNPEDKVSFGKVRLQADRLAFFGASLHVVTGAPVS